MPPPTDAHDAWERVASSEPRLAARLDPDTGTAFERGSQLRAEIVYTGPSMEASAVLAEQGYMAQATSRAATVSGSGAGPSASPNATTLTLCCRSLCGDAMDSPAVARVARDAHLALAFGRRVRSLREDAQLSQEALADRAKVHRTYIGHVERGESAPTLYSIVRIAEGLGEDPGVLVRGLRSGPARKPRRRPDASG